MLLVLLTRMVRTWKQALFIVQPETDLAVASPGIQAVLEVHVQSTFCQTRDLGRDCGVDQGDGKQQSASSEPNVCVANYSSWAFASACRTIQKYMRPQRTARPRGQKWSTFLHTHAEQIWACDFLSVTDLLFRSLFAFFMIELKSRRVIHIGVTRCPTDAWTARTSSGGHRLWRGIEIPHP